MAKFNPGRLVATLAVSERIWRGRDVSFERFLSDCIIRFLNCDWGDIATEDAEQNNKSVRDGEGLIYAVYKNAKQETTILIFTEWYHKITTIWLRRSTL